MTISLNVIYLHVVFGELIKCSFFAHLLEQRQFVIPNKICKNC